MGKTRDLLKRVWAFVDKWGSLAIRHPIGIYLVTGVVGAGITFWVFTTESEQNVAIAGFLFTIWALMLTTTIYLFSTSDGKKSQEDTKGQFTKVTALVKQSQADMKQVLAKVDDLTGQSQADAKQLLVKVEDLAMQLGELTRSPEFHGRYETNQDVSGNRLVTKSRTGDNYVVSLYGRPRFLITKLSPYSADSGDSRQVVNR